MIAMAIATQPTILNGFTSVPLSASRRDRRLSSGTRQKLRVPAGWNRSRATALCATLLLHAVLTGWLLTLRFDSPEGFVEEPDFVWVPVPVAPVPPPVDAVPTDVPPPPEVAPISAPPLPMPVPDVTPAAPPDWSRTAREVAKGMTAAPGYQPFGETPKGPAGRPKEQYPPSIWPRPLPRVGKTVVTAEGETILWVSDYCYVSISSRSLTQKEIHDGRKGVRTCILAQFGDKKKPRDDLFDAIERPPPPQEPGCGTDGVGQSCAR